VRSTAEAEYEAMTLGVALILKTLLIKVKLDQRDQMKLWCDNKLAISIANNLVQHDKTKHVDNNYHCQQSNTARQNHVKID
jgi:hypothetical protein